MIKGKATPAGAASYAERFTNLPGNFRPMFELAASSLGIGTYLGEMDPETDEMYREAAKVAVAGGVNVIDSAVNYRMQRSERSIGAAIRELVDAGHIKREELIVSSKGGYITFDGEMPANPREYFDREFVKTGLIGAGDLVENSHCMTPKYLDAMIEKSRANLGLETIDVYFLHNPEAQVAAVGRKEFMRRVRLVFELLEGKVGEGAISVYGTATWNGFRVRPDSADYLSLQELVDLAATVGGPNHHFKVIQLPYSLAMPEAFTTPNQNVTGENEMLSPLEAARALGIAVWASASLLQGRLTARLPEVVAHAMDGLRTDAQRSIQFVRSTPGANVALVGMKTAAHVTENLETLTHPPAPFESFMKLFTKP
ncbi:MAG TPA: aldo/keto reductase [Candidatus Binataceae bacterium]|jgi:aryl-alcohol dehydrogenase-like predicted oxidoreductase|nr:aldo/keto reductase [Candidatus Binataceae bacterium]